MHAQPEWRTEKKYNPIFWIFVFGIVFALVYQVTTPICIMPGTVSIMVVNICVTVLVWMKRLPIEELTSSYTNIYIRKQFYRVISAAFTHVLPIHILMNLVSLFNIGSVLEPYLSSKRFLIFYFFVLIIGGFFSAYIHKTHLPNIPCIGASGALCGLFGIYIAIVITIYGEKQLSSLFPTIGILCIQIFWKQIDSLAHFSGLIIGIVLGIAYLHLWGY